MEPDLVSIILFLRPGASWSMSGETYDDIDWTDEVQTKPTLAEIDAARISVKKAMVVEQRKAIYPSVSDPIFFEWQRGEKTEQDWLDAVQSVRDQYPF